MANTEKLKEIIDRSGLKKSHIAEKLGITSQGFWKKENGQSDFTASEIRVLKDILNLSDRQVMDIFLSKE